MKHYGRHRHAEPAKTWDELDVFNKWPACWLAKPRVKHTIKQKYNRRIRRTDKQERSMIWA